jgi:transcriptional regulator with XRE-family HTH domain
MDYKPPETLFYGTPLTRVFTIGGMTAGRRIKALRLAMGMDQGELAKLAKIAGSTLSDLERGDSKQPRGDTLVKLAAVLKVDQDWLITGEGLPVQRVQPNLDESELLHIYRDLADSNKQALLATARALLGTQPNPTAASPLNRDTPRIPKQKSR